MKKRPLKGLLFLLEIAPSLDPTPAKLDTQTKADKVRNPLPRKVEGSVHSKFTRHHAHPRSHPKIHMAALVVDDRPVALIDDLVVTPPVHPRSHAQIGPHILPGKDIIACEGDIPNGLGFGDGLGVMKQKLAFTDDIAA